MFKRSWRAARFIASGIAILCFCALLLAILLAIRVPRPPEIRFDSLSAQTFDDDFRKATIIAQSGTSSSVIADESELNSKLQQFLHGQIKGSAGVALKDARIKLIGDHIEAYLLVKYRGRDLALRLTGKVHKANGYAQLEPDTAAIGALPFPKARVQVAAAQMLEAPNSPLKYRLPSNIGDIHVEDGKVVSVIK